jgi:cephalosporin hydroxylase
VLEQYRQVFLQDLIAKTDNFGHIKWLGHPIWQNVFDLWTIQETLAEVKPALLIETGTNRGGSALFFAHLFDLLNNGKIITVDVQRMHTINHARIEFLIGSSLDAAILTHIRARVQTEGGPIMVILDSDHRAPHVYKEMESYGQFVTNGSFMLVQDGVIDTLPVLQGRPGPLVAIREFLGKHAEFEVDKSRCERFLISHHPMGWLRRITH